MRWIYISPHLDDAVLSAGGLIYEQARTGRHVEIWTVVCGFPNETEISPFAQELHFEWGCTSAEETVRSRRNEDRRAAEIVGATAVHFDVPDCIYRRGRDGNWLYSDVFVAPHPDEADLPTHITATIAERLERGDKVICPLAIGGHVDHVTVRRAVEALGRPLWYYADIPYLLNNPSALEPLQMQMQATRRKVSSEGLTAWQDGIAAYASQVGMLFDNPENMRTKIADYGQNWLRLWKPA
jgi:LmbE family N-acetylglucosaminyl deacetylase